MERREFFKLAGGTLLLLPGGLFLVRFGGSSNQGQGAPMNQPTLQGTKLVYTSSMAGGHTHTQLSSIKAGQTVPVTSGVSGGHTHLFTFLKLA